MKKKVSRTSIAKEKDHPATSAEISALFEKYSKQAERNMGGLMEEFQHRTSAIAEQFGGLNTKVDSISKKLDEQGKKLDEHGRKLDEHGRKLDEHSKILDTHTQMIGQIMIDVQEIKNEKVGRAEFARLEKRIVIIENKLHGVRGR